MPRQITNLEDLVRERGFEYIGDTSAHTAPTGRPFIAIQIVTTAVFNTITADTSSPITGTTFTGVSIPAGTIIQGRFTSITLTSGTAIAYKGV